jgi:hypothetical protein
MAGGKQYIYCPFNRQDDRNTKLTIAKYKNKPNCKVITTNVNWANLSYLMSSRGVAMKPLKAVEKDATLVVMAHGDYAANAISVKGFGTEKGGAERRYSMTADTLAKILSMDGLPTTHYKIRLLTCWAGGPNQDDLLVGTPAASCFARVLAIELGGPPHGYANIYVAGYKGIVNSVHPGNIRVGMLDEANEDVFDSDYSRNDKAKFIVWYDAGGNEVAKPTVP